jgi:hypothetical protein
VNWENIQNLQAPAFRRATGISRRTFEKMVEVIKIGLKEIRKHPHRRRPCKLKVEDQLLMTLMYWREYRTYFHIGLDYGLSEASVCRISRQIEKILVKSKLFSLPGKKRLLESESALEVIIVDASEHPIERPKKK